jgi:hypothetical protein
MPRRKKRYDLCQRALDGKDFKLIDYVPCYRSIAGTGNAMGFGYWE